MIWIKNSRFYHHKTEQFVYIKQYIKKKKRNTLNMKYCFSDTYPFYIAELILTKLAFGFLMKNQINNNNNDKKNPTTKQN